MFSKVGLFRPNGSWRRLLTLLECCEDLPGILKLVENKFSKRLALWVTPEQFIWMDDKYLRSTEKPG